MIQDITPRIYHNEYKDLQPKDNDFILVFHENKVLVRYQGEKLRYPTLAELREYPCTYHYLFSIDNFQYFLASPFSLLRFCAGKKKTPPAPKGTEDGFTRGTTSSSAPRHRDALTGFLQNPCDVTVAPGQPYCRFRRRLREVIPTQRTAFLHRPKALWKSGPVWYWGPFSAIFYCIINERVCDVKFHFSGSGVRLAVSIIPLPKHDHSLYRFLSGLFDGRDIQADP